MGKGNEQTVLNYKSGGKDEEETVTSRLSHTINKMCNIRKVYSWEEIHLV